MAYKIGWFSTGRDQAAADLLRAVHQSIQRGEIEAEISFVFSNRRRGEAEVSDRFFRLVKQFGIDLVSLSSRDYEPQLRREDLPAWRRVYDRQVMQLVDRYQVDLNVLAGYMLILSEQMCRAYTIINLHPAAPGGPKGTWQEVIWQLIEKRAESTGVTIHRVTEILDEGPPITYCRFPIRTGQLQRLWEDTERRLKTMPLSQIQKEEGENNPLFRQIRQQGVIREIPLIVQTIKWFAQGRIKIKGGELTVDGQKCPGGLDMTEEIDQIIGREK
ncbi:MAG: hypothetical protein DRQ02_06285 [Candidatus Latescibacterota bacterium]|nr:MAG: hypothetical protein DRQ02_06285 [Candidatus Latescibacterota bacterium]